MYILVQNISQNPYPAAFLYPLSSKTNIYKTVTKRSKIIFGNEEMRKKIAIVKVPTTQDKKA